METYNVKFLTPGQILVFRNKRARTPVTFERVLKSELPLLEAQARRLLLKYDVSKTSEVKKDAILEELDLEIKEDEDIEVEELSDTKKEPSTILEKLLASNEE